MTRVGYYQLSRLVTNLTKKVGYYQLSRLVTHLITRIVYCQLSRLRDQSDKTLWPSSYRHNSGIPPANFRKLIETWPYVNTTFKYMFRTRIQISNQNTMYIGKALTYLISLPSTQLFLTQKDSLKQLVQQIPCLRKGQILFCEKPL